MCEDLRDGGFQLLGLRPNTSCSPSRGGMERASAIKTPWSNKNQRFIVLIQQGDRSRRSNIDLPMLSLLGVASRHSWIRMAICLVLVFLCFAMIDQSGSYRPVRDAIHALRNHTVYPPRTNWSTCSAIVQSTFIQSNPFQAQVAATDWEGSVCHIPINPSRVKRRWRRGWTWLVLQCDTCAYSSTIAQSVYTGETPSRGITSSMKSWRQVLITENVAQWKRDRLEADGAVVQLVPILQVPNILSREAMYTLCFFFFARRLTTDGWINSQGYSCGR